ncbi:hypothetical protein AGMMS50233_10090 [Endomicrobiia bacterium]|nr:hypothetical protein AGMMS50233_10090 [Endomicrobiia bacterium]
MRKKLEKLTRYVQAKEDREIKARQDYNRTVIHMRNSGAEAYSLVKEFEKSSINPEQRAALEKKCTDTANANAEHDLTISSSKKLLIDNKDNEHLDQKAKDETTALINAAQKEIDDNSAKIITPIKNKLKEDAKKRADFESVRKNIKDAENAEVSKAAELLKREVRDFNESTAIFDKVTEEAKSVKDRGDIALENASSNRKKAQERSNAAQKTLLNELSLVMYYDDDEKNRTQQKIQEHRKDCNDQTNKLNDISLNQVEVRKEYEVIVASKKGFADDKLTTKTNLKENNVRLSDAKDTHKRFLKTLDENNKASVAVVKILQGQVDRNEIDLKVYESEENKLLASLTSADEKMNQAGMEEDKLKQTSERLDNDAAQASAKLDAAKENIKKTNRDSNLYKSTISNTTDSLDIPTVEGVKLDVYNAKLINNYSEITHQKETIDDVVGKLTTLVAEQKGLQENIDSAQKELKELNDATVQAGGDEQKKQELNKRKTELDTILKDLIEKKDVTASLIATNKTLGREAKSKLEQAKRKMDKESEKEAKKNTGLIIDNKRLRDEIRYIKSGQGAGSVDGSTQTDEIEGEGEGLAGQRASADGHGAGSVDERRAQGKGKQKEKEKEGSAGEQDADGAFGSGAQATAEQVETLTREREQFKTAADDAKKESRKAQEKNRKAEEETEMAQRETRRAQEEIARLKEEIQRLKKKEGSADEQGAASAGGSGAQTQEEFENPEEDAERLRDALKWAEEIRSEKGELVMSNGLPVRTDADLEKYNREINETREKLGRAQKAIAQKQQSSKDTKQSQSQQEPSEVTDSEVTNSKVRDDEIYQ